MSRCPNCDNENATLEYKEQFFCSFLCIGAYELNKDPEMRAANESLGISKKRVSFDN